MTYNWIDMGQYKDVEGVRRLDCCYTRPDGVRICGVVLCEDEKIEEMKKMTEQAKKAVPGEAWTPTKDTKWRIR